MGTASDIVEESTSTIHLLRSTKISRRFLDSIMTSHLLNLMVCLAGLAGAKIHDGQQRPTLPIISVSSPGSSSSMLMQALRDHGAVIFTGLGDEYTAAIERMTEKAPSCLDGALKVTMDDGSQRFTLARDTISSTEPLPPCLAKEAAVITDAFDRIDEFFSQELKQAFGQKLNVFDPTQNSMIPWEDHNSKTHLHVYSRSNQSNNAIYSLPYHTDNGFYVLLTPSDNLPLRSISRDGSVHLFPGKDNVILILGTGLTEWLLPEEGLYPAPHALPALSNSLTSTPRTVMARMKVAPAQSLPQAGLQKPFDSHFLAPLQSESGPTLARLRKQRSAQVLLAVDSDCQTWPHACTHD